ALLQVPFGLVLGPDFAVVVGDHGDAFVQEDVPRNAAKAPQVDHGRVRRRPGARQSHRAREVDRRPHVLDVNGHLGVAHRAADDRWRRGPLAVYVLLRLGPDFFATATPIAL